jgi:energy-coupling factor transporter transmembrane protein EcfT
VRTSWHLLWGSGRGSLARLAPQTRVACAAAAVGTCLLVPVATVAGLAAIAATVAAWLWLCRPPTAAVRDAALFGLALLSPVLLLMPMIRAAAPEEGWTAAAVSPWSVLVHGVAVILVSVAAASTVSQSALRQALAKGPVPEIVALILLQILQQTSTLLSETRRMEAATAVRGGAVPARTTLSLLISIPKVWLPRIIARADRLAAAMDVRGFDEVRLEALGAPRLTSLDALAIAVAALALAAAAALRLGIGR